MTSEDWVITSDQGYEIVGRTDYAGQSPSPKCFVIVHGYCGSMFEHMHVLATSYFVQKGYDVVRFNLQNADHKLRNCTLQTHAHYLNTVLEKKCAEYDKVFLSGHSYGGPTIMIAQPKQAAAICLWDPSFNLPELWNVMAPVEHDKFFVLNFGGNEVLAGKAMAEEGRTRYKTEECLALSESLNIPVKVINASQDEEFEVFKIDGKSWHSAGHLDNCRIVIEGANHDFTNGNTVQILIDETYDWFERYA